MYNLEDKKLSIIRIWVFLRILDNKSWVVNIPSVTCILTDIHTSTNMLDGHRCHSGIHVSQISRT